MTVLAVIGALAIRAVIAAGIYFFGGYYSVAAAKPNPAIIDWALARIRDASIDRHVPRSSPVRFDDPAVEREGARAY